MSYQVLARKWRPRNFATMVGQEHVLRALINALDNDRLHHAYLFTGTRGVGKTTVARIFAKSLNCEKGITSTPCGVCSACREIDEGRFVDLIEVDAASRTKVEDTRELLENVQYAPTRGRYKVYLIDEVHMLSTHSFNALLKTLEEPPPHVKFLLATTDPQKLPVTILSRCLQFNLKRLSKELIAGHLISVMEKEQIATEPAAIALIAEGADGSMRDALSLLDQAIAYGGGKLTTDEVATMLGAIDRSYVFRILQGLADESAQSILETVHGLAQQGVDFTAVLAELVSQLHQLALIQVAPQALDQSPDLETIQNLARAISPEDVQLYYQIGLIGRRDLPYAPDPRSGFEMVLLRMLAFRPVAVGDAPSQQQGSGARPAAVRPQPPSAPAAVTQSAPVGVASPAAPVYAVDTAPALVPALATASRSFGADTPWHEIVAQLDLKGMVQQLAVNSVMTGRDGSLIKLQLSPQHTTLRSAAMEQRLQDALQNYFGEPVKLSFTLGEVQETPAHLQQRAADERQQAAVAAINNDPNVQRIRETFNAEVITESIRPIG
jgi:DNA polymerase-3 subunit gamma/tau